MLQYITIFLLIDGIFETFLNVRKTAVHYSSSMYH